MPNIDRSDQKLTLGSTTLTWDQQTAADGEGGTPRSCTEHATARLHTRIRQRSTKSCNNYEPMVYLVVFLHWQATHRHRVLLTTVAEHATHGRHCVQSKVNLTVDSPEKTRSPTHTAVSPRYSPTWHL